MAGLDPVHQDYDLSLSWPAGVRATQTKPRSILQEYIGYYLEWLAFCWPREWKINLIQSRNVEWNDLYSTLNN